MSKSFIQIVVEKWPLWVVRGKISAVNQGTLWRLLICGYASRVS